MGDTMPSKEYKVTVKELLAMPVLQSLLQDMEVFACTYEYDSYTTPYNVTDADRYHDQNGGMTPPSALYIIGCKPCFKFMGYGRHYLYAFRSFLIQWIVDIVENYAVAHGMVIDEGLKIVSNVINDETAEFRLDVIKKFEVRSKELYNQLVNSNRYKVDARQIAFSVIKRNFDRISISTGCDIDLLTLHELLDQAMCKQIMEK